MKVDIEVEVQEERQQVWPYIVVGLYACWVFGFLWWVLAAVAVAAIVWQVCRMVEASSAAKAAIINRAELQHQQVIRGDERGIYGAGYRDWRNYRNT